MPPRSSRWIADRLGDRAERDTKKVSAEPPTSSPSEISKFAFESRSLEVVCLSGLLRREMSIGEGICRDRGIQDGREQVRLLPTLIEAELEFVQVGFVAAGASWPAASSIDLIPLPRPRRC